MAMVEVEVLEVSLRRCDPLAEYAKLLPPLGGDTAVLKVVHQWTDGSACRESRSPQNSGSLDAGH